MQLPPGAEIVTSGPRFEKPTLVPAWRSAATAITMGVLLASLAAGWQFAGEPTAMPLPETGSPLPAAATTMTPLLRSAVNAST
jgi:hypothetical protein